VKGRAQWRAKSLTLLLGVLSSLVLLTPLGENIDNLIYDFFFSLRGIRESPHNIVIVAIDESSFDEISDQWPWPRSIHAKMLDEVFEAGAKTVAFDVLFAESSPEDEGFGKVIEKHKNVISVYDINVIKDQHTGFEQNSIIKPRSLIEASNHNLKLGLTKIKTETDGIIRRFYPILGGQPSLSLKASQIYIHAQQGNLDAIDSFEEDNSRWINFLGPARTIKTISYYQALNPKEYLPQDYLKDALIFVGFATASGIISGARETDHYPTSFSLWGAGYLPGVEIHAQAASGFLSGISINRVATTSVLILGVFLAVFFGYLIISMKLVWGTILFAFTSLLLLFFAFYLFVESYFYISPLFLIAPLFCVFFVNPFLKYLHSLKQRRFLHDAFSTYLAPQVVTQIIQDPTRLSLGGEEQEATIFFLDLVGFTAMSESLTPKELLEVVNRTLGSFSEIILKNEGMIDKFIGDCIMAAWSLPLPQLEHATKAVEAALEMQERLPRLQAQEQENIGKTFSFRIGISTGPVIAGNVGGGKRFNYTALGNDVNLAARLESLNKQYGTQVIISESTARLIGETVVLRKLDKVRVVGQQKAVTIYEVCGRKESISSLKLEAIKIYSQGLEFYFKKEFPSAIECFTGVLEIIPDDQPSLLLLQRCREYINNEPDGDWDGAYSLFDK